MSECTKHNVSFKELAPKKIAFQKRKTAKHNIPKCVAAAKCAIYAVHTGLWYIFDLLKETKGKNNK
jgi:hypothetical protein